MVWSGPVGSWSFVGATFDSAIFDRLLTAGLLTAATFPTVASCDYWQRHFRQRTFDSATFDSREKNYFGCQKSSCYQKSRCKRSSSRCQKSWFSFVFILIHHPHTLLYFWAPPFVANATGKSRSQTQLKFLCLTESGRFSLPKALWEAQQWISYFRG